MTARRPDQYQRECESLQRRLEIANCHLQKSEKTANALKEMLEVQKDRLRAKLKKSYLARSKMPKREKKRCA